MLILMLAFVPVLIGVCECVGVGFNSVIGLVLVCVWVLLLV